MKAGPSQKREVIVGRRKAAASNINVLTAMRCMTMFRKFLIPQVCKLFLLNAAW